MVGWPHKVWGEWVGDCFYCIFYMVIQEGSACVNIVKFIVGFIGWRVVGVWFSSLNLVLGYVECVLGGCLKQPCLAWVRLIRWGG